jgi:intein-encoded DNA endonuclease-like protein
MTGLITSLTALASEGLRLANIKLSRKYVDEMFDIREQLLAEEAKGFNSDDQKIVELRKRLKIVVDAANQEINLLKK